MRAASWILLVEDDPFVREAVKDLLEDDGHYVRPVSDGAKALACLEDAVDLPDAVVLDLVLPVMDGWQLYSRMQESPRLAGIPVVVLSGVAGLAGPRLYPPVAVSLAKPLCPRRLLEAVSDCRRRAPAIALA